MVPFTLDFDNHVPLARQFAEEIKKAALHGVYRTGDVLPPVKEWARMLKVSEFVPRRGMKFLSDEGLLIVKRHVGAVVTDRLARRKKGKIIFLTSDNGESWNRSVFAYQFTRIVRESGYRCERITIPPYDESKFPSLSALYDVMAEGVIFAVCECSSPKIVEPLVKASIPFVVTGSSDKEIPEAVAVIRQDMTSVLSEMGDALCQAGCRDIIHVRYASCIYDNISAALVARKLNIRRIVIRRAKGTGHVEGFQRGALEEFERRLKRGICWLPDAFLFSDDFLAAGALLALAHHGVRIPEDVKVVTLANKNLGPIFYRDLARFEYDSYLFAQMIATYVLSYLAGEHPAIPVQRPKFYRGETL